MAFFTTHLLLINSFELLGLRIALPALCSIVLNCFLLNLVHAELDPEPCATQKSNQTAEQRYDTEKDFLTSTDVYVSQQFIFCNLRFGFQDKLKKHVLFIIFQTNIFINVVDIFVKN